MPPFYGFNPLKVDFRQIEKRAASQMELFAQVFYYGYESDKSFRTEIIKDANYSLSQSYLTNTVYDGFMRARGKYISSPFALDTACTDGLNIYINPFMAASMTTGELIFVMSHELLHILLGHLIPDNSSKNSRNLVCLIREISRMNWQISALTSVLTTCWYTIRLGSSR